MAAKATGKGEPAKQVAIDILRKAGQPLLRERDRPARARIRPLRRAQGQDARGDDQRHARRRLEARRAVHPRREGHLHPRQRGNDKHQAGRAEASCEANARTQASDGAQEDHDSQVAAREAHALTQLATSAAGAAASGSRSWCASPFLKVRRLSWPGAKARRATFHPAGWQPAHLALRDGSPTGLR